MAELIKCSKCGHVIFSTDVNCPKCGSKNEQTGQELQEDTLREIGSANGFTEKMDAIRKELTSLNEYTEDNPYPLSNK